MSRELHALRVGDRGEDIVLQSRNHLLGNLVLQFERVVQIAIERVRPDNAVALPGVGQPHGQTNAAPIFFQVAFEIKTVSNRGTCRMIARAVVLFDAQTLYPNETRKQCASQAARQRPVGGVVSQVVDLENNHRSLQMRGAHGERARDQKRRHGEKSCQNNSAPPPSLPARLHRGASNGCRGRRRSQALAEFPDKLRDRRLPLAFLECQRLQNSLLRFFGKIWPQASRCDPHTGLLHSVELYGVFRPKGHPAGRHFVGDYTQAIEIARCTRSSAELLGRHIAESARDARSVLRRLFGIDHRGDAEIDQFDPAITVLEPLDHDIFGLQIAMPDATSMSGIERSARLAHNGGDALDRQSFRPYRTSKGLALDILHDQERVAVFSLPGIRYGDDVGMTEPDQRLNFVAKLLSPPGIQFGARQDFDYDPLGEKLFVHGKIYDAKAAVTQFALDQVAALQPGMNQPGNPDLHPRHGNRRTGRGGFHRPVIRKAAGGARAKHAPDFVLQAGIASALAAQKALHRVGGQLKCRLK